MASVGQKQKQPLLAHNCPEGAWEDKKKSYGGQSQNVSENKGLKTRIKTSSVPDTNLILACLVTLCFHPLFGIIAAYLSVSAARAYRDGRPKEGERKAFISVVISLVGIVFTVCLVMTLVLWLTIGNYKKRSNS